MSEADKVYEDTFREEYQRALLRETANRARREALRRAKLDAEKAAARKTKKGIARFLGTLSELGKRMDEYEFGGFFAEQRKGKKR